MRGIRAVRSNRRSVDVVASAPSGALAILPGWAFSGPFSWGLEAGHEPAATEQLIELDAAEGFDALPNVPDLGADSDLSTGSAARRVVAAEVLWRALAASRFDWQRSIALEGRLLSFYCAPARVALEIIDPHSAPDADGGEADRRGTGVRLVPISIADVEQRCATVVGWLDELCAGRSRPEPAARVRAASGSRWRRRRPMPPA